jgi:hypothetical protein
MRCGAVDGREGRAVTPGQQTVAMLFGAAVALTGLVLFTLKHEESETRAKLFGIELTVKTPSIVIFAMGCIIFLSPFVPFFRAEETGDSPTGNTGTSTETPSGTTTATPTGTSTVLPSVPAVSELRASPIDTSVVPADGSVWVVVTDEGPELLRLDPSTLRPNLSEGFSGVPVQVVAVGDSVWVLTEQGVLPFDPNFSQFKPPVLLGGIPGRAVPALGSLWIVLPNRGLVVRFDMDTNGIIKIPVGLDPEFVVLAANKMWVANEGDSTITPILPNNNRLPPIPLPDAPVAMISFRGAPLVATADGSVKKIDPTGSGELIEIARVDPGRSHLFSTDAYIWAWQTDKDMLWRIDSLGGAQRHALPFAVEKLTELGGVLWAVAADGRVAEVDASNASIGRTWSAIGNGPLLLARVELRRELLLFAEDGTVHQLRP